MSYFLRKSIRKRGLYLQIYESFYCNERKKTVTRFVKTLGYHEDLRKIHYDPVEHGLSLVRAMNFELPKKNLGKPRRAEIDRARFVDIVKPLELLRRAMAGESVVHEFQERLSFIGDIATRGDEEGRNLRRAMSRLWESHDSLLRGLVRMSREADFIDEINEVGLFPLIPSKRQGFLIITDRGFFPLAILDSKKFYESKADLKKLKVELPEVSSYIFYGSSSAYEEIPDDTQSYLTCLLRNPTESDGAKHLFSIVEKARGIVEAALPQESQVPASARA